MPRPPSQEERRHGARDIADTAVGAPGHQVLARAGAEHKTATACPARLTGSMYCNIFH
jgi:hypothetical protein